MAYRHIKIPEQGQPIGSSVDKTLAVPNRPIVPYIEGDGIGEDVCPVMLAVVDAAVQSCYGSDKKIAWMEVYNGEKAAELYDGDWFPQETLDAIREYRVAIKGPLTTPIGGGFRSLNIALRQEMDLYVSLRPVKWISGVPAPVTRPENIDIVVFRENSEDIYSGIEWRAGSQEADTLIDFIQDELGVNKIRFPDDCAIGLKPVSKQGSQRLVERAIQYAIDHDRSSVTLVHKGDLMKFTEGGFKRWGYELAKESFGAEAMAKGPFVTLVNPHSGREIIIKDMIADTMLQQLLLKPEQFDVVASLNQNGDYIADMLAAQVGAVGIAPGANLNDDIAFFEATHGTAPRYAGLDKVNPCSMILAGEMLLRHIGWTEAATLIVDAIDKTIADKTVTYDLARRMDGATEVSCSGFGDAVIANMV